tara:strand:- start:38 stop:913 length:876 start_codon:yes stop_codon:yes gene_type:complete
LFKVFAFLKRNSSLLTHDEYRAGHVGFHCCNSRRLKNIRGYLVNIWSNETLQQKMGNKYKTITSNEPENFLDYWDGFPEVYFDNRNDWISAATPEPNRATKNGLSLDESWTLGDGPFLFDNVESKSGQFKSNHLRVSERQMLPVFRPEKKISKIIQFFKKNPSINDKEFNNEFFNSYNKLFLNIPNIFGLTVNFRDKNINTAVKDFFPKNAWCFSEEGKKERKFFAELWDGITEIHVNRSEDFIKEILRLSKKPDFIELQEKLFSSIWYVEVDENLIVLPNRDPSPDFYYR